MHKFTFFSFRGIFQCLSSLIILMFFFIASPLDIFKVCVSYLDILKVRSWIY